MNRDPATLAARGDPEGELEEESWERFGTSPEVRLRSLTTFRSLTSISNALRGDLSPEAVQLIQFQSLDQNSSQASLFTPSPHGGATCSISSHMPLRSMGVMSSLGPDAERATSKMQSSPDPAKDPTCRYDQSLIRKHCRARQCKFPPVFKGMYSGARI